MLEVRNRPLTSDLDQVRFSGSAPCPGSRGEAGTSRRSQRPSDSRCLSQERSSTLHGNHAHPQRPRPPQTPDGWPLSQVSNLTGDMELTLVAHHSPFSQGALLSSECFILDNGTNGHVYVWKGGSVEVLSACGLLSRPQVFTYLVCVCVLQARMLTRKSVELFSRALRRSSSRRPTLLTRR